jgi:VCBS repeat-containing protein
VTITPYAGNETAALVGTFSFTVPAGSVTDLKGNAFSGNIILEVLDITAPEISSGLAKSLASGDVIWEDGKFTVDQGYMVDTIEITMNEPVQVALGTVVTMEGYGPYGTVTALSDALVTITPYAGNETAALVGTFSFSVPAGSLTDLSGNAFSGSVTLEVLNVAPTAVNDQYLAAEDTALVIPAPGVLANDQDFDVTVLQAQVVTNPAHGTLSLAADGSFVYTPAANYNGSDSFTYIANDGLADSNTATVTLTVAPVNDAPQAVDDNYEVAEDGELEIAAPGVMANDIEVDPDGMTVTLLTGVSHGSLTLLGDGSFIYQPNPDFNGSDSFVYQLITYPQTQSMWTDEATVTINVLPINDTPVAVGDAYSTDEDVVLTVPAAEGVLANDSDIDGDALSALLVDSPAYGTLNLAADGSFVYTPAANYYGADSFTYKASDGEAQSALVTVQLTINSVNDTPVAQADDYAVEEDSELTVAAPGVLGNDSDADGDTLTLELLSETTHGTLSLNADGSFTYTPDENFFGVDSFTYRVSDGNGGQDEAEVTIRVGAVNDWPIANDDTYETMAGVTLIKTAAEGLLINDVLLDPNETVTLTVISEPQHGTLTLNNDGSFTYVPDPTFFGVETFVYQLNSTIQTMGEFSDTATVTITVHPAMQVYLPLVNR